MCFGWPGGEKKNSNLFLVFQFIFFSRHYFPSLLCWRVAWSRMGNADECAKSFCCFFCLLTLSSQVHPTIACTTFMAALEASVLRTPWASVRNLSHGFILFDFFGFQVLIVLLTQGGFAASEGNYFLQTFPLMILSVMVSMIIVYW